MIYICFGMTKSASTFVYQLTEQTFRVAGRAPARLGPPFRPRGSPENYFDDIDPALLDAIAKAARGRDVVLKTHQGLHPEVARRIEAGEILASASVRDPREIALSMVDHGRKARRMGLTEFSECRTVFDAWPSLDNQVANLGRWSALKSVEVFRYNEISFETASVVSRIAAQIGVAVDAPAVVASFRDRRRIGQFNKGEPLRYREMPAAEQAAFLDRYAGLYAAFRFDTPAAVAASEARERAAPRRWRGFLRRGLRLAGSLRSLRAFLEP
ncbi:hypothetical protein DFR50_113147 [Roseiarcus fermentans]|uniref:Sulfotransferase family protein n=1 Tax=Roseiarcus fermentans TaxID=1473586 RepID=A0A366FGV9_9HYPH|nr:hypothetical protein [Roseiarcus fermentans]RBP12955.1 hypothetical protein DFR50_113147 [Roseiarcus fermentans]